MATEKVCENKLIFTDRILIDVDGVSEYSGISRAPSAKVEAPMSSQSVQQVEAFLTDSDFAHSTMTAVP